MSNETELQTECKASWLSLCCNSGALGELSFAWWEIRPGGRAELLREGLCSECNQKANFHEPD